MIVTVVAAVALALAAVPAALFRLNLWGYRPPPGPLDAEDVPGPVSLLIPARNESLSIGAALEAALATRQVDFEIVVLDDHSQDDTAAIVASFAARDPRVRLESAPPLPPGWCGKQHACHVLAQRAKHPFLIFADADVRIAPDCLARLLAFLKTSGADLASGFPHQETGTWLERLVIPLIHFLLLGFLPLRRMRRTRHPAYGAGCGQLMIIRRAAYERAGGHAAIRATLHDGLKLPRAFRAASLRTDLFDATEIATCRMYRGAGELWAGLAKNASEGMATPALILPVTALLLGGHVLPFVLLAFGPWLPPSALALALGAAALAYSPRLAGVFRFRQSWRGAMMHPLGIVVLLAIQWYALTRSLRGRPAAWKGRVYPPVERAAS